MIRVCPNCKTKNPLPTEGDHSKMKRPVCSKCREDLFPSKEESPTSEYKKVKIESIDTDKGFLKETFWPHIVTKTDAENVLYMASVLTGFITLSSFALIFLNGYSFYLLVGILSAGAGLAIYSGFLWVAPIIAVVCLLEFFLKLKIFIQTDGNIGGAALALSLYFAGHSCSILRAWYFYQKLAGGEQPTPHSRYSQIIGDMRRLYPKIETSIKKNKIITILIGIFTVLLFYFLLLSGPKNYEECFIDEMNNAKNTEVAKRIHVTVRDLCRQKFPITTMFGDVSKGRIVDPFEPKLYSK